MRKAIGDDETDAALHQRLLEDPCEPTDASTTSSDGSASPHATPSSRRHQQRRQMSAVERLVLSPYDKWVAHGRFPYKILLHVLLLALTLLQMTLFDVQNASYLRASHRNWAFFFLPPSGDVGVTPRFTRDLYSANQTRDAVFFMRDAYFSIANDSLANYEYQRDPQLPHESIRRIDMTVVTRRRSVSSSGKTTTTRHYRVPQFPRDVVGPFLGNATVRQSLQLARSLVSVAFTFHLRDRQYGRFYDECFDWAVHASLRTVEGTRLRVEIDDCEIASCSDLPIYKRRFVWLHVVIAGVALGYLVLSGRALLRSVRLVTRVVPRQRLSLGVRLKLLNRLQLLVFVSLNLLLLSSLWSLFGLKAHVPIRFGHRLLQASAMLLLWSSLVGYLEHNQQIYSIVLTLRWGAPRVLQFLVGVSPIFVGFAFFGTIYFGARVKAFGSLSASMMTLFAVLNGDVILDTVDALALHHFELSGKLYIYAFIALFIYVVLNIFIAIVEEAFFATRNCRRLLDVLLSDPRAMQTPSGTGDSPSTASALPPQDALGTADADVSNEMVRLLLRLIDESELPARAEQEEQP